MIAITLPVPPSENQYRRYVPGLRAPIISREGREFKRAVAALCAVARLRPLSGSVSLHATLRYGDRRRRDIDNSLKALMDALTGYAYADDSQVDEIVLRRGAIDRAAPGCDVTVCPMSGENI